jgi:thiamine biosynthesis protein ThiI
MSAQGRPTANSIDVRYDEIGLKGGNRSAWEKQLRRNLIAQTGVPHTRIQRIRGRLTIDLDPDDDRDRVLAGITRTFGVRSASPTVAVAADMNAINAAAIALARHQFDIGLRSFRVSARRPDKRFPVKSQDMNVVIGNAVMAELKAGGLTVDCEAPQFTIGVEVRDGGAVLHSATVQGPGGLPVSVSGRGLLMLSGGIDSPVAGWQMMKRGMLIDSIYFHAFPFTGDKTRDKVLELARRLAEWSPFEIAVHVASTTQIQDAIGKSCPEALWTVLLRRFMYRIADALAERKRCTTLITGEALGQVASQTIENLRCVEAVVPNTVVFRPLTAFDKSQTIDLARAIGTFDTSCLPYDDCCTLFAPRRPATAALPVECERAEAALDVAGLVQTSLDGIEIWIASRDGVRRFEHETPAPQPA